MEYTEEDLRIAAKCLENKGSLSVMRKAVRLKSDARKKRIQFLPILEIWDYNPTAPNLFGYTFNLTPKRNKKFGGGVYYKVTTYGEPAVKTLELLEPFIKNKNLLKLIQTIKDLWPLRDQIKPAENRKMKLRQTTLIKQIKGLQKIFSQDQKGLRNTMGATF